MFPMKIAMSRHFCYPIFGHGPNQTQTLVEFQSEPNRILRPDGIEILQIISNLSNAIINNPSKLMEFILVYTTHLWQI